ncbi:MAG: ABC transporter permease subunit [Acholeplasmataceae bacterium]|jgi:ABC-2 type transport system permease protein|nr:ABC transporter permease subunit [Acholeplasmataceae bacterium]
MKFFSMAIFKLEMKRNMKSNLIWSFALGLSLLLIVSIYPIVKDMMRSLLELMENMDPSNPFFQIMNDFGGIPTSGIEYFATEGAMILQLVGGIYAAILGFSLINKDEKEKTNEVLYTLPISKSRVLNSKICAMLTSLFMFTMIQFALSTIGFISIDETAQLDKFWLFGLLNYVMFLIISIMSMFLSAMLKPNQSSLIAVAIPFPFYIITMISQATNNSFLKSLKYISPFTFAEPVGFFKTGNNFETVNLLIFVIISLVFTVYAINRFQHREII